MVLLLSLHHWLLLLSPSCGTASGFFWGEEEDTGTSHQEQPGHMGMFVTVRVAPVSPRWDRALLSWGQEAAPLPSALVRGFGVWCVPSLDHARRYLTPAEHCRPSTLADRDFPQLPLQTTEPCLLNPIPDMGLQLRAGLRGLVPMMDAAEVGAEGAGDGQQDNGGDRQQGRGLTWWQGAEEGTVNLLQPLHVLSTVHTRFTSCTLDSRHHLLEPVLNLTHGHVLPQRCC